MFFNSLYYTLKPFIPRRLQIQIRRQIVQRKRVKYAHIWPIDERAAKPPEGWTGWPDGKKFALVLTHDVETAQGREKCLKLMELEKSRGFRSSFNFIADESRLSPELRLYLEQQGFEVGVHGLRHNINLFESKTTFQESAKRINQYLKDWQSVGFRAPSMYHNLDWIGDLDIQYDSSTFDTDPFEPQPDGVGTIFPFWVPSTPNPLPEFGCSEAGTRNPKPETVLRNGYIELPYTLPQDFTLFVIMGEKNIDIWKKKLDWIAKHGGMALLITHPDYMNFSNKPELMEEYPVEYYKSFLEYVKEKYEGAYWHAPPKEIINFWRNRSSVEKMAPRRSKQSLHVCMLSYSFYENDARVKRYAETLAARGDQVDVIGLKKNGQDFFESQKGVNVYRIQERIPDETSRMSYLGKILRFLVHSTIFLSKEHMKRAYDLIHVHSIPDFEVFAGILPKLSGAKLILDIHDIVPELYASKFNRNGSNSLSKSLLAIEKASAKFSDHVIISNHIWEEKLLLRSVSPHKCTVILNHPDPAIFFPRTKRRNDDKFIMVYPGTLNWHQGLDLAIRAFSIIKEKVPNAELHIYGRGSEKENLKIMIEKLDLRDKVLLKALIPIDQIAEIMANADLGIIPKRNDPFGGGAFSTKILEFMSLGVPVVVSATKIDKFYFNDSVVKFFEPGNVNALSESMLEMIKNPELRTTLAQNALKFVEDFSWEKRKHEYLDLIDRLTNSTILARPSLGLS